MSYRFAPSGIVTGYLATSPVEIFLQSSKAEGGAGKTYSPCRRLVPVPVTVTRIRNAAGNRSTPFSVRSRTISG